jgi:hypothetical protein
MRDEDVWSEYKAWPCLNNSKNRRISGSHSDGYEEYSLRGLSPQANCTDRDRRHVGEVSANFFRDRGCRVVSATEPHGRILDFLDRGHANLLCIVLSSGI